MSFQALHSQMRSTFQGNPVHMAPTVARRSRRGPVQVQALGLMQSAPIIFEAMKIGFASAAIPGVIKGAWDVKQAMAVPNPEKPLTQAKKSVLVSNQAALYGSSGALIGLCAGIFATQGGLSPEAAWQAGTVAGLGLSAMAFIASKPLKSSDKPVAPKPPEASTHEAANHEDESVDGRVDSDEGCTEDECELPGYEDNDKN